MSLMDTKSETTEQIIMPAKAAASPSRPATSTTEMSNESCVSLAANIVVPTDSAN